MGFAARQEQQMIQLEKAYDNTPEAPRKMSTSNVSTQMRSEIRMDGIDQAYVWMRTFTPSWIVGLIFLAGILTLAPLILKKLGINLIVTRGKK